MPNTQPSAVATPEALLAHLFERNGYLRRKNETRYSEDGYDTYKKGYEVRLVLQTQAELRAAKRALAQVGLTAGKPFAKAKQTVLPLYGLAAVEWFSNLDKLKKARPKKTRPPVADKKGA